MAMLRVGFRNCLAKATKMNRRENTWEVEACMAINNFFKQRGYSVQLSFTELSRGSDVGSL